MRPWTIARHPRRWRYERARRRLAERTIDGEGLEIGALHSPFPVPARARVRYVDRMGADELRAEYPEMAGQPLVEVDVVDDGETLATVAPASQDFVIASHFLEHCEDTIGTLEAHARVLRPGGILLLALPDRLRGVDRRRAATTVEHLVADHEQGPKTSRSRHYREWAELVDAPLGNIESEEAEGHALWLEQRHYRIHFHCWTADEFAAVVERLDLPFELAELRPNHHEFLVALRRREAASPRPPR